MKCPDGPYPRSEASNRRFSKAYCYRLLSNGERIERDWLLYSKKANKVYCFACKLFGGAKTCDKRLVLGYNNWQCLSKTLQLHETSNHHIDAYLSWNKLTTRLQLGKTIDSELQKVIAAEKNVLTRVIDCILFLAERNLPLRGKTEQLGSTKNGNFLGLIELLARYDVTMAEHLREASSKKITSYLSWCTQNEFLQSISECIVSKICTRIKAAKYFAVQFDCTPDISKQEQASVIIRYVHTDESKKTSVQESFVGFTAVKDTTGQGLAEKLIEVIEKNLGLELINCRGQSYDNGSNMNGIHKGVQALILEKNPEAIFIPCCSHSLNLILCDAASSNRVCLTFFGTLQRLYTIFSSSVKRWDILKEFVEITLKPLSDTRWEAKLDSVKALRFQLGGALDALEKHWAHGVSCVSHNVV